MSLTASLNYVSAATALVAAVFWLLSSWNKLPPPVAYFGPLPSSDPFFAAIQKGILLNRIAAFFAAISALANGSSNFVMSCSTS